MFSTHLKMNFCFEVLLIVSSGNALNLDQSEMLSFGKGLNTGMFGNGLSQHNNFSVGNQQELHEMRRILNLKSAIHINTLFRLV